MLTYDAAGEELLSLLDKESLTARDVAALAGTLPHCDGDLRQRIAESLINADPEEAWPLLKRLSDDGEWLVRTEACQTLGDNDGEAAAELLLDRAAHDPEELVQVYALHSLGELLERGGPKKRARLTEALLAMEREEKSPRLRLALQEALYRGDRGEARLGEILQALKSPDYTLRCSALNSLEILLTPENREPIYQEILRLKKTEPTPAVQSAIARLEQVCRE